ncbi:unnamed protein product, partial [Cochlearia groenlandica]
MWKLLYKGISEETSHICLLNTIFVARGLSLFYLWFCLHCYECCFTRSVFLKHLEFGIKGLHYYYVDSLSQSDGWTWHFTQSGKYS